MSESKVEKHVQECGPFTFISYIISLGNNCILTHEEDDYQWGLSNPNTQTHIFVNNGTFPGDRFIHMSWKRKDMDYSIYYNSENIFDPTVQYSVERFDNFYHINFDLKTKVYAWHKLLNCSYDCIDSNYVRYYLIFSDKMEIKLTFAKGKFTDKLITERNERIQILVKGLKFNGWRKAAKEYIRLYREKRRKRILNYILIMDLCKIVDNFL